MTHTAKHRSMHHAALVTGFAIVLAATQVWADGFRNPPESATAIGKIGGRIALMDDPSAVTLNPANIADMTETEIMGSVNIGYAKRELTGPTGVKEDTRDNGGLLPSIFAVMPLGDSGYVAGIGVHVAHGRSAKWESDASFSFSSPYSGELGVVNINPTIATRLSDTVRVGAGVSIYWSRLTFDQNFPWALVTGAPASPPGVAEFEADGVGFGANAAITWTPCENHALALTVRSPFDVDFDGDFKISNLPPGVAALGATSGSDFETTFKFPTIVALGYGFALTEDVNLEFNVEWLEHSRNQSLPIDIGNNSFLLPSTVIPQAWDDNWTYGVGLDWQLDPNWVARAGFIYLETPTPTATTIPTASEEDQSVVSIGLGHENDERAIDVAYALGIFGGRTISDNLDPSVNGKHDFESHIVSISYRRTL